MQERTSLEDALSGIGKVERGPIQAVVGASGTLGGARRTVNAA